MWKLFSFGSSRSTEHPTETEDNADAYANIMQPWDAETAVARFVNHMRAFSLEHRDALGYPVGCRILPAWEITNSLPGKAKRWMKERYDHGIPMTFREMVTLLSLLDDAVTEAASQNQDSCCGFWGLEEWNESKTQIEMLVAAKFV